MRYTRIKLQVLVPGTHRSVSFKCMLISLSCAMSLAAASHGAVVLNPGAFTSLGSYSSSGGITVTTGGTPNWPGIGSGVTDPATGLAVFTFTNFTLQAADT